MDVYVFQAALLCTDCASEACAGSHTPTDEREDSDKYPQGPYVEGGGEADSPQHCDYCGLFLENPLTLDGESYVRDKAKAFNTHPDMAWTEIAAAAENGGQPVLGEWIRFYLAWG